MLRNFKKPLSAFYSASSLHKPINYALYYPKIKYSFSERVPEEQKKPQATQVDTFK